MLRFATDTALPPVFAVVDREAERQRLHGVFPPACAAESRPSPQCAALATFVRLLSLEQLLEARGEGLSTQPHINATLDAAYAAWHADCLKSRRDAASCEHPSWRLGASAAAGFSSPLLGS